MHSFLRMRSALWAGFGALALSAMVASVADAKPRPGNSNKGFRLFARPLGALVINRVLCGLSSTGEICVDSTNSSTIGGGFWPKGTADQYVFNSGIQVAGIIGEDANPEWQGDTTGAQFFSPRGDNVGEEFRPIYNANNPDDVANWPQAAFVPQGDASEELFNPLLRGRVSASQGDVWFVSWEGNPAFSAGREHPLGVLIEQRGLGFNFPAGNEDVLYFIYTFYNITATDPAAYAAVRPGMREILVEAGGRFHDLNEQRFGITIPDGGYTITNFFAAFGADMDVAEAGANFASVNVPFSLGYTYEHTFAPAEGWTFDPRIFSPPFFPGSGFVGVKYLKSPLDPVTGEEVGLTLFSNTINGGAFDDPANVTQLYRYLSNNISVAAGDAACNTGDPRATRICFTNNGQEDDMRHFQASGPLQLAPGAFGSIVVAYIFAAPVSVGACTGPGTCDLKPGDPTRLSDPDRLISEGANAIDSVSGYAGFRGATEDGTVVQDSITVVPGSLLGKALVAQEVFRNQFLLPFAPETPDFFLIPGNNQVTVLWRATASETTGDPFFAIANAPLTPEGSVNPLYDPNYRNQDVEGYRVYRGRVDSPNSLQLLAQFDFSGTVITDFQGQVNPATTCAPEIGINTPTDAAPCGFDSLVAGVAPTTSVDVPLVGPIVQVARPNRVRLGTGEAILLAADTASVGGASGCLTFGNPAECDLRDTGVPFVYIDETARNNLRYFYSVTAFDINSFQSGPSSLESPRSTKSITPVAQASNFQNTADVTVSLQGRGVVLDNTQPNPTIDPATGRFSGPFPPANDFEFGLAEFVQTLLAAPGQFSLTLDSIGLGSAYDGIPNVYHFTGSSGATVTQVSLPIAQDPTSSTTSNFTFFTAITPDASLAQRFGGSDEFKLTARILVNLRGNYYTSSWGRGCVNSASGFGDNATLGVTGCEYNGQRWFDGPSPANNETLDDPQAGHPQNDLAEGVVGPGGPMGTLSNGGALTGVTTVHIPHSYETVQNFWRQVEGALGGVMRSADYNVYWGAAGLIDSVIDVTHNLVVPFSPTVGASWGILNQANANDAGSQDTRAAVLTVSDMGCVEPFKSFGSVGGSGGIVPCSAAAPFALTQTAVPGSIAIFDLNTANAVTKPPQPGPGFILYLPGTITIVEMAAGVPAAGAVWTMRSYVGSIRGGQGTAGDRGPYNYVPRPRPLTTPGITLQVDYDVVNQVVAASETDLGRVHTVPDPYYVTSAFEQTTDTKVIKFVNLPAQAIIRIYSSSGVLVDLIEHNTSTFGGTEDWDVRSRNNQVVASGVYFYHIEAGGARRVGRFTVVNFAQ